MAVEQRILAFGYWLLTFNHAAGILTQQSPIAINRGSATLTCRSATINRASGALTYNTRYPKSFLRFLKILNTLQENPFYDFLIAERFFCSALYLTRMILWSHRRHRLNRPSYIAPLVCAIRM